LYAGGLFTSAGAVGVAHIAKWNEGPMPVFSATPGSLNFGDVVVGTSKQDSIKIKNLGTAALNISSLAVGIPSDFSVTEAAPINITAGDSAKIHVTYNPTVEGLSADQITFTHNGLTSPNIVSLNGMGVPLSFHVSVPILSGWNMISNPVTVTNDSVKSLYPTSLHNYAFGFYKDSGYVQRYTLSNGQGYWEKFPASTIATVTGTSLTLDSINVVAGWNMIGSISIPVAKSSIVEIPSNNVGSQYYGYNSGYAIADTLKPGHAYWVKVLQNGKLVLR
jgi:hypothetical protein